jgi:hypothetical protein
VPKRVLTTIRVGPISSCREQGSISGTARFECTIVVPNRFGVVTNCLGEERAVIR